MASSSFTLPIFQGHLHKSHFLGQTHLVTTSSSVIPKTSPPLVPTASAKFNLFELLGGRGLCNGEEGLEQELSKTINLQQPSPPAPAAEQEILAEVIPEDAFEKELLGLTGGFPGGEKGLQKFIEKNPPPPKRQAVRESATGGLNRGSATEPKPPERREKGPPMVSPRSVVLEDLVEKES
ncbi:hypothetical protein U1Q18_021118 [Sarracenia purpurea var. burkii]